MAENVFILGAGASVHAGLPLMKDFFDDSIKLYLSGLLDSPKDISDFETIKDLYFKLIFNT